MNYVSQNTVVIGLFNLDWVKHAMMVIQQTMMVVVRHVSPNHAVMVFCRPEKHAMMVILLQAMDAMILVR